MKIKLKLLLLSMMFIGLGLSFCSANFVCSSSSQQTSDLELEVNSSQVWTLDTGYYMIQQQFYTTLNISFLNNSFSYSTTDFGFNHLIYIPETTLVTFLCSEGAFGGETCWDYITYLSSNLSSCVPGGGSSSSDIDVYYNNGNSTETITCDGVQAIQINGLSTITSTNTFTPYYNISYTDEDNQKLIESYSNDILYLENGQFKKTYTGDNERILTDTIESPNSSFSGYVPVFDFTGDTIVNTGNVFNNFSDNALKVLLSNIPSYIQYITIFMILVFLFSFIRRFKRKN